MACHGKIPVANWDGRAYTLSGSKKALSARRELEMDFWSTALLFAFMAGIMGWTMTPFTNAVLWFCDWQDGVDINWGLDTAFSVAVPFAWMFAIFEIILLYCQ